MIIPYIQTHFHLSDEELLERLNFIRITKHSFYINARTVAAIIGPESMERLMGALKAQVPTIHAIMQQVGPNDGSSGGMDVGVDATRAFLNQLVQTILPDQKPIITSQERDALQSLGETRDYDAFPLLNRPATLEDIQDARIRINRAREVEALRSYLNQKLQSFYNNQLRQAEDDPNQSVPTVEDFVNQL